MTNAPEAAYRRLLDAVSFAARAHRHQLRKDGQTPYAAHPFRACLIVRHVFGVDDPSALMAAVLHDTIEDTTTDHDDLAERFGIEVANWVALLSKDKRLAEDEREEAYRAGLAQAPWQVKLCKLADVLDNTQDCAAMSPEKRARTLRHSRYYLEALDSPELPPSVRRAWNLVSQLVQERERGESGA
jgi:guanosine-3',5'-bis(diphosphate) 3'-pyrophosphohydrolase